MEVQNQPLVPNWRNVFLTVVRLLSFRATTEELLGLGSRHLAFGLLCTWIVGIGRYWDNLPLSAIVVVLSALNLEHVVFNLMGGLVPRSENDDSYAVVLFLAFLSLFLFIPLLISYIALVSRNLLLRNAREESKDAI